jgi:hypothetical protein
LSCWHDFHSVEYIDPETDKLRELDLMLYKLINGRRLEIRVSCKSSTTKQFVFFTRDVQYFRHLSEMKTTPVCDDVNAHREIPPELASLRFFSHPRHAVNYTVLTGEKVEREARTLLRDALMSAVSSIHHRILPRDLMLDPRGCVYLFVVVLRGRVFDARFDETANKVHVEEAEYARWRGLVPIPRHYYKLTIPDAEGRPVPFANALYWFGNDVNVVFVKDTLFESYLRELESAFGKLNPDANPVFGKPWTKENFPKIVGRPPRLGPIVEQPLEENESGERPSAI